MHKKSPHKMEVAPHKTYDIVFDLLSSVIMINEYYLTIKEVSIDSMNEDYQKSILHCAMKS